MSQLVARQRRMGVFAFILFTSALWGCWGCGGGNSSDGVGPTQHSVELSWNASTSTVAGSKIYRGMQHLGPYVALNASPHAGTTFTDSTVRSGTTYYYVVTAVDAQSEESAYSNEVTAVIPSP